MASPVWIDPEPIPADSPVLHPDPLLNALLLARVPDPTAVEDFLDPRPRSAPDPFLLPGMAAAAERVGRAVEAG